jgi:large subunit ribosomal protein L7/L12
MATADVTAFADNIKTLGDSIVKLTVLEAKALGDYLENVHGIKAAAAAIAAPAAAAEAAPAAAAQTEFEVILESFGAKKLEVIKVIRAITGLGLADAKGLVEAAPKSVKAGVTKDESDKLKKDLEEAGATVKIK